MSLINCPECGKEISDRASSCPNCGCPIYVTPIEDEEIEENEKESGVSIATLVCYILSVIFYILSAFELGILLSLATIILLIISYSKKGKCVCANIVFWINTIGFTITTVIGIILLKFF